MITIAGTEVNATGVVYLDPMSKDFGVLYIPNPTVLRLYSVLDAKALEIETINYEGSEMYLVYDPVGKPGDLPNLLASVAAGKLIHGKSIVIEPAEFMAMPFEQKGDPDQSDESIVAFIKAKQFNQETTH